MWIDDLAGLIGLVEMDVVEVHPWNAQVDDIEQADTMVITASPTARKRRLFVDYLRNGRGTTAVGTYSPRARPGFFIAAPVSWASVERGMRSDEFTMTKPPRAR